MNGSMPIRAALAAATALVVASGALAQSTPSRYMGQPATLVPAPNGAVFNAEIAMTMPRVRAMKPEVRAVAPGLWQLMGMSIVYPVVIEGDDGLIVWDTGDNAEEGDRFAEAIRKLSPKPVKAIIYSHAHYPFGAGRIATPGTTPQVFGHPALMTNVVESGGWGAVIPELAPVLKARAVQQFNNLLPKSGPDAALEGTIEDKPRAFLPVTHAVRDGEVITVAGVKLQFFTRFASDSDDNLTVWLPDRRIALNNLFWPVQPNLYSPRGAKYRDPLTWRDGLRELRNLDAELLLSTHTFPVQGKDTVRRTLNSYMDALSLIYDQTVRGILHGRTPDELRQFVALPPALRANPNLFEGYGELQWIPPNIYNNALGWFDGDAVNLSPVPADQQAERIVALAGGRERVAEAARAAQAKQEFAWAAQLATYLLRVDPADKVARQLKADALRAMGQRAMGSIPRAWYLSQARALEGAVELPVRSFQSVEEMAAVPAAQMIDQYRVRIDPRKSDGVDTLACFDVEGSETCLHARNGIAEFIAEPSRYPRRADIAFGLDRKTLTRLFVAQTRWASEIEAGTVTIRGDRAAASAFLGLFDDFSQPARR